DDARLSVASHVSSDSISHCFRTKDGLAGLQKNRSRLQSVTPEYALRLDASISYEFRDRNYLVSVAKRLKWAYSRASVHTPRRLNGCRGCVVAQIRKEKSVAEGERRKESSQATCGEHTSPTTCWMAIGRLGLGGPRAGYSPVVVQQVGDAHQVVG